MVPDKLNCTILIPLLLTCFQSFSQLKGPTFKSASESGKAKIVCVTNEIPGLAKKGESGEISGALVKVMKAFKNYLHEEHQIEVTLRYELILFNNFDIFLRTIETAEGGVFGLSNVAITEKREKQFLISTPFMKNKTVLITNLKGPDLPNIANIKNQFKALTPYSHTRSNNLNHLNKIKMKRWEDMPSIRLLDSEEEVARWVANAPKSFGSIDVMFYLLSKQEGLPIKRHPVGDGDDDMFGVVMPKNSDWKPVFDTFLVKFREGIEYRKIVSEHLGKSALRLIQNLE